jgi:hypothetical protein
MSLDDPFERMRHRNYSDWAPNIPTTAPAAKYIGYFNSLVDQTNVLCFFDNVDDQNKRSDPLTDLRMWSQYGKSHRGCCIVVNKETTIEKFSKVSPEFISDFGKVVYGDLKNYDPIPMSRFDQDGYKTFVFKHLFHTLFFTKAIYYLGENEFRFAVNNGNQRFAFEVRPIIKRVVIAENSEEMDQASIVALCRMLEIEVGKMVVSNDRLEYRVIPI